MSPRPNRALRIALGCTILVAGLEAVLLFVNVTPAVIAVASYFSGTTDPLALLHEPVPAGKRFNYGVDDPQFGELRLPEGGGPYPVAIVVHGGCWVTRLPGLPPATTSLDLMRPVTAALARAGIATWNIEYRRLGNAGGGWPGTYQDLGKAADFLRGIAAENHLDLSRVIVIGHSAGGHLGLWLGARRRLPASSPLYSESPLPILGVLDIEGPPDLATPPPGLDEKVCGAPVIRRFMGGSHDTLADRYREGSATGLLPLGIRQELVVASKNESVDDDQQIWARLFQSYAASAGRLGDAVNVSFLEKGGHFDGINPQSASWPVVIGRVRSLLSASDSGPGEASTPVPERR